MKFFIQGPSGMNGGQGKQGDKVGTINNRRNPFLYTVHLYLS